MSFTQSSLIRTVFCFLRPSPMIMFCRWCLGHFSLISWLWYYSLYYSSFLSLHPPHSMMNLISFKAAPSIWQSLLIDLLLPCFPDESWVRRNPRHFLFSHSVCGFGRWGGGHGSWRLALGGWTGTHWSSLPRRFEYMWLRSNFSFPANLLYV